MSPGHSRLRMKHLGVTAQLRSLVLRVHVRKSCVCVSPPRPRCPRSAVPALSPCRAELLPKGTGGAQGDRPEGGSFRGRCTVLEPAGHRALVLWAQLRAGCCQSSRTPHPQRALPAVLPPEPEAPVAATPGSRMYQRSCRHEPDATVVGFIPKMYQKSLADPWREAACPLKCCSAAGLPGSDRAD